MNDGEESVGLSNARLWDVDEQKGECVQTKKGTQNGMPFGR